MKLFVVGFEPRRQMRYPHLKQVVDRLPRPTRYIRFRERGYFLGDGIAGMRDLLSMLQAWSWIAIDSVRLAAARLGNGDAVVVAVDNFAYVVASLLFRRVVLWSHDFLTPDVERFGSRTQRMLRRGLKRSMERNGAIVIQDDERLKLFEQAYMEGHAIQDVFFLPVSLTPAPAGPARAASQGKPVLMQIGGINAWRSCSDRLLQHFQAHGDEYQLAFNGFIDSGMKLAISNAATPPTLPGRPCPADDVHLAVAGCDVGFIAYNADNLNFFHVARASGQLVEFVRCGKPVIVLGRSSLADMVSRERVGIAIDTFASLDDALRTIVGDYDAFSDRAIGLFSATYNLDAYTPGFIAWLASRREG